MASVILSLIVYFFLRSEYKRQVNPKQAKRIIKIVDKED